jgi:hypothetical protein
MSCIRTIVRVGLAVVLVVTLSGCLAWYDDQSLLVRNTCGNLMIDIACLLLGGHPGFDAGGPLSGNHKCYGLDQSKSGTASAGDVLYLAATAHVSGALGTDWRSDVELHNLGAEPALVSLWLLEHGSNNSSPTSVETTIEAGRSVRLRDVLAGHFDLDGQAALALSVGSSRIIATSRTYNLLAAGNPLGLPGGSTFGQYIPALSMGETISSGQQGRLIQLSHNNATDGGFRTNLGLVNATSDDLHVEIDLHEADGTLLGSLQVDLPPYGYRQLNRVFASVTSNDVTDGYALVRTTTSPGAFFAYASVVDNLTGDPIAISAMRVPVREPQGVGEPVWVVAGAHVAGVAGTNWRTDLEVHCWGEAGASYDIELLEHGADNSQPESRSYTLDAGTSVRFEDILDNEFDFAGQAALRIAPTAGHVLVTSRTYNLLGEDNATGLPAGATFGQYIPGVSSDSAIRFGEEGRLIQLSHTPGGASGFRTNLILVSSSPAEIDVEIDLYNNDGSLLGTVTRTLAPLEYRQINRVFEGATSAEVEDGYAVVRTTTDSGEFFSPEIRLASVPPRCCRARSRTWSGSSKTPLLCLAKPPSRGRSTGSSWLVSMECSIALSARGRKSPRARLTVS